MTIDPILLTIIKNKASGEMKQIKRNLKTSVLKQLAENSGRYQSGEKLSESLGVSRSAIWKQVKDLRGAGYLISSRPNRGYRLEGEPELLDQDILHENKILYLRSTDSTNREIRRLAEEGAPQFHTLVAEEQTGGRGRLGRKWISPPGKGLWFSILLLPRNISPTEATPVTLVSAVALARYLGETLNLPVQVKWPNDLLIKGRKIAGILTELKGEPERVEYLITGIGINVNQERNSFPAEISDRATSLFIESGMLINRSLLLVELRNTLVEAYNLFFSKGFRPFQSEWKKISSTLEREVTISRPDGQLRGKAVDLDEHGTLLVRDSNNIIHPVRYGEIL